MRKGINCALTLAGAILGSPQEFVSSGILGGFPELLKSDEFNVGHGHPLGFQ